MTPEIMPGSEDKDAAYVVARKGTLEPEGPLADYLFQEGWQLSNTRAPFRFRVVRISTQSVIFDVRGTEQTVRNQWFKAVDQLREMKGMYKPKRPLT